MEQVMPVLEIMIHSCDFDFGRNQHVILYLRFHPSLPKSLQPDCILPLWQSSMNFRKVLKA